MTSQLRLASTSLAFLGSHFTKQVFGNNRENDGNVVELFGSCCCSSSESGKTEFFLAAFASHECAGTDWIVLFFLFLVVHAISWWPRWLFYEPFYNSLRKHHNGWSQVTAEKFAQAVTAASFHIGSGVFAWRILRNKPWLWAMEEWSQNLHDKTIEPDFKLYYLLYAARYLSDLVSLGYEHARSDTVAYAIHHVASVALVLTSAHFGCTRIGGAIMFFFDWADPPMMIGKSFLYLSLNDPTTTTTDWYQWIADRCMEVFVVMFIVTRNIVFSYITWICFQTFPNDWPMIGLKGMLLVLVGLMTFWFCLILKIIHHQFFQNQGNVDDIREHQHQHADNDTQQHTINKTKKKQ